jgi:hypothetical protein
MGRQRLRARLTRLERGKPADTRGPDPVHDPAPATTLLITPAMARALRDDYERVSELLRKQPISAAELEEKSRRASPSERARLDRCSRATARLSQGSIPIRCTRHGSSACQIGQANL